MGTCEKYELTFQLPECLKAECKYQFPFEISYEGNPEVLNLCSLVLTANPLKIFSRLPILQPKLEVMVQ
ncbi:MAG: hypothetical protein WC595_01565 [Candidatus Nanoarchaeia archaeon]